MADDRCQPYQGSSTWNWSQGWQPSDGSHKRGLNSKIHLAVDAHGMPVRMFITDGPTADCSQAARLIEGINAEHLLADKAYDVDAFIKLAVLAGISVVIPPKRNRKVQREYEKDLYKLRHLVENAFMIVRFSLIKPPALLVVGILRFSYKSEGHNVCFLAPGFMGRKLTNICGSE